MELRERERKIPHLRRIPTVFCLLEALDYLLSSFIYYHVGLSRIVAFHAFAVSTVSTVSAVSTELLK